MKAQTMIKRVAILFSTIILLVAQVNAQTWDEWFEQRKTQRKYLLQQIAKLQLYLSYAKKGYNIVQDGLRLVGDIKNGDFNLHHFFFDRLSQVSPAVKRYAKVSDIIIMQQKVIAAYKARFKQIKESGRFNAGEMDYIHNVLSEILDDLAENITLLTLLLTDGQLEMQDNERLKRIDDLHVDVTRNCRSFYSFTNRVSVLAKQRELELNSFENLQKLY